jgi:hypothetical protein
LQVGFQLAAAAADGLDVQAGDQGQQAVPAVAELLGFQGGEPAPLRLVQTVEQQVHAVVQDLVRMRPVGLTVGALAAMNFHRSTPLLPPSFTGRGNCTGKCGLNI